MTGSPARIAAAGFASGIGDSLAPVFVHPGQIFASGQPREARVVLGSCVAVTIFDPTNQIGGVNHFMLPIQPGHVHPSARFGDIAIVRLVDEILALGARRSELEAGVFGGACVIGAFRNGGQHLGAKNLDLAYEYLRAQSIPIRSEKTGGERGIRLRFHTATGECRASEIAGDSHGS